MDAVPPGYDSRMSEPENPRDEPDAIRPEALEPELVEDDVPERPEGEERGDAETDSDSAHRSAR